MKKQNPINNKQVLREQTRMTRPPRLDGQTKGAHMDRAGKKKKGGK